ncbi:MAG: glycosyltransferase family 2 protein [Bacteroidales bacterium]|jgi:glycosyltransferase involved in cell wall biosynthesis|nr:glycosyltransferase family 2 protein [Bacteroidales bacterium]
MISVVIPLYNKAHTIERTLGSVLTQTFKEFEVIIVNDGSTDNGVEVIKNFTNDYRVRIINQENQGVSVTRNRGVAEAKYEYIAFLDGDDEWISGYLQSVINVITKFPTAGMICTAGFVYGGDKMCSRIAKKYNNKVTLINFFENPHVFVHTSATVVKKTAFYKTQGFPAGMKNNEDYACFFSIAMISDVVYNGCPLSIYWGNIPGQATSEKNMDSHVINRHNLCYANWVKSGKQNRTFLIFMKYEIRHQILGYLKNKNATALNYLMDNLSNEIKRHFSSFEWLLYKKWCTLSITYIYLTKIIWRTHGYPVVNYK